MEHDEVPAGMETQEAEQSPDFDAAKVEAFGLELEARQNLFMGVLGGVAAALVSAAIWAGVTVATGFQIGWMAIGVGFIVGYAVQVSGKGLSSSFGIVGAVCALLGCVLGNLLSVCGFISVEHSAPFFGVAVSLFTHPELLIEVLVTTFSPMDVIFYAIALYEGYRFSFREITQEEWAALSDDQ
jgi:hypothetical protein